MVHLSKCVLWEKNSPRMVSADRVSVCEQRKKSGLWRFSFCEKLATRVRATRGRSAPPSPHRIHERPCRTGGGVRCQAERKLLASQCQGQMTNGCVSWVMNTLTVSSRLKKRMEFNTMHGERQSSQKGHVLHEASRDVAAFSLSPVLIPFRCPYFFDSPE